ncbi:uncharacterized [Lates japonicus]
MASASDGAGRRGGASRSTSAGNNGDDNKTGGKPVRGKLNGWSQRDVTASRSHEDRAVQPPAAQLVSISRAARFSVLKSGRRSTLTGDGVRTWPMLLRLRLERMGSLRGIKTPCAPPSKKNTNSATRTATQVKKMDDI